MLLLLELFHLILKPAAKSGCRLAQWQSRRIKHVVRVARCAGKAKRPNDAPFAKIVRGGNAPGKRDTLTVDGSLQCHDRRIDSQAASRIRPLTSGGFEPGCPGREVPVRVHAGVVNQPEV